MKSDEGLGNFVEKKRELLHFSFSLLIDSNLSESIYGFVEEMKNGIFILEIELFAAGHDLSGVF